MKDTDTATAVDRSFKELVCENMEAATSKLRREVGRSAGWRPTEKSMLQLEAEDSLETVSFPLGNLSLFSFKAFS